MTTAFARTFISQGDLVAVEVLGLPNSSTDPVFTYRAHADLGVGDLVLVEAPAWSVRVTHHPQLPGFILGPADEATVADLDAGKVKMTLALPGTPESVAYLNGHAAATAATWSAQADALEGAASHIREAVKLLTDASKR